MGSIAGGTTADDPINLRELAAANESGEGEYRNKRRTEKHLGAGKERPLSVGALYCEQSFPDPVTWNGSKAPRRFVRDACSPPSINGCQDYSTGEQSHSL